MSESRATIERVVPKQQGPLLDEFAREVSVLNISGDGEAFVSDVIPPAGASLWLRLEVGAPWNTGPKVVLVSACRR